MLGIPNSNVFLFFLRQVCPAGGELLEVKGVLRAHPALGKWETAASEPTAWGLLERPSCCCLPGPLSLLPLAGGGGLLC